MAVTTDTLFRWTAFQVGTTGTALDGQVLLLLGWLGCDLGSGRSSGSGGGGGGGGSSSLTLLSLALGLLFLGRVARALLAASVLALLADPVGTEGGLAAVALAVDTHTDGLLDTLDIFVGRAGGNPLVGFQSQAVLGEECTRTLLLGGTARVADLARGRGDGLGFGLGLGSARSVSGVKQMAGPAGAYLVDAAGSGFFSAEDATVGTRSLLELPLFKTVRSLFTYLPMLWRRS